MISDPAELAPGRLPGAIVTRGRIPGDCVRGGIPNRERRIGNERGPVTADRIAQITAGGRDRRGQAAVGRRDRVQREEWERRQVVVGHRYLAQSLCLIARYIPDRIHPLRIAYPDPRFPLLDPRIQGQLYHRAPDHDLGNRLRLSAPRHREGIRRRHRKPVQLLIVSQRQPGSVHRRVLERRRLSVHRERFAPLKVAVFPFVLCCIGWNPHRHLAFEVGNRLNVERVARARAREVRARAVVDHYLSCREPRDILQEVDRYREGVLRRVRRVARD